MDCGVHTAGESRKEKKLAWQKSKLEKETFLLKIVRQPIICAADETDFFPFTFAVRVTFPHYMFLSLYFFIWSICLLLLCHFFVLYVSCGVVDVFS